MKSILIVFALVALALSTPVYKEISKRDVDSDAELIDHQTSDRSPGIIVDIDDDDDDDDDDFGSNFGFVDYPRYGYNPFVYWRRRIAEMNRFFNMLFNRPRPVYPIFPFGDVDKYPPEYSNSTITTKVVNGSVITVNETITKHQSNGNTFFIHTKTVHVRPENANETVTTTDEQTTAPELVTRVTEPRIEQPTTAAPTATPTATENDQSNDVNAGRNV